MANTLITPTALTREALRILHQKLHFVGNINRQYDSRFANSGAKIGNQLQIRKPNQFVTRTGATLNVQDVEESFETLTVSTQKGVDFSFTSDELTMTIDDFSQRYLEPAMSVLAAHIEDDALSMYKDVSKEVATPGDPMSLDTVLLAQQKLDYALAPREGRCLLMGPRENRDLVSANVTLYNDRSKVSSQYRKGLIGNDFFGFDTVYSTSLMPNHQTGSAAGPTIGVTVDGAGQTGSSITVTGVPNGQLKKGDIITFDGCNDVHYETKADLGELKQFTVTADTAGTYTTIEISPPIVTTGAKQNVSASPDAGGNVNKTEADGTTAIAADANYNISLGFHKDAFTFATADLVMPQGVDFSARDVMDGISMRVVRNYDINNDAFPCRIDVLYGYETIRDELAVRLGAN